MKSSSKERPTRVPCPICNRILTRKKIPDSEKHFWRCSNLSTCQYAMNDHHGSPEKGEYSYKTGQYCPACDYGELVKRQRDYGVFYGCNRFPRCKTAGRTIKGILKQHENL